MSPLLTALSRLPGGATAAQLATALKRPTEGRDIGVELRRLVEQGQVLETRPGRYQVSGTGGEFSAVIEALENVPVTDPKNPPMQARLADGRTLKVNANYRLNANLGDVAQVVIGDDGQALVTRVLRRTGREVVGTMSFGAGGPFLIPDNRREGQLKVLGTFPTFNRDYQAGNRVVGRVEVDPDGRAGAHLLRILGDASAEVTDFTYVRLVHDLPGEFPPEVEAAAAGFAGKLTITTNGVKREDLRKKLIFTIDPVTAKDFDDAISLEPGPDGGWILGVHIADVSHYVTEHGAIDAEAVNRGTSIYLINRVIPMLPETLSNGLCSLVPKQDRYCLSAFLTVDRAGNLLNTRMAETIINSRHRMTYEQAMAVLDGTDSSDLWPADLRQAVTDVGALAQAIRRGREKAGALNLFSVEHRFKLDVNGFPIDVVREGSDESHQLIEECMLLANRAVAQWLEEKGLPCVYRIHEPPDVERLQQFAMILEVYGKDASQVQNRFGLQKLLGELASEPPAARLVLNFLCLRSFKKAVYSTQNIGHHALAFASYCHFTSPIRRYPDLLVHRLVKRGLNSPAYRTVEIRPGYLDALAKQASYLEQRAENSERDLHARKSARYLAARIGEVLPGVVMSVSSGGLSVQLLETGMEGFVPLRELKDDFYVYEQEKMCLVGRHSARVISVGIELDVQINAVDVDRADVVFGLAQTTFAGVAKARPAATSEHERPRRGGGHAPRGADNGKQRGDDSQRGGDKKPQQRDRKRQKRR